MTERDPRRPRLLFLKPFTARVFNPLVRGFIHWLPGFALVVHRGRRSGRLYRTPMTVFRDGTDYILALTYGRDSDWVKNVMVAGEAELRMGASVRHVVRPQLFVDGQRRLVPLPVRILLRLMRVDTFLLLHPTD